MQQCARCGSENPDGSIYCTSCGAVLVPPDDATVETPASKESPYLELSRLGPDDHEPFWGEPESQTEPAKPPDESPTPPPQSSPRTESPKPRTEPVRASSQSPRAPERADQPPSALPPQPRTAVIPEWVLPAPPAHRRDPRAEIPGGRGVRFAVLLVLWLAVFYALPAFTIWSTSPFLKEAIKRHDVSHYVRPSGCVAAAKAASQDPALCSNPVFARSFTTVVRSVRSERNRVAAFYGVVWLALALALLVLILGTGLRGWWWFAIFFTPLAWFVQGWALWRLSAHPVRYWQPVTGGR